MKSVNRFTLPSMLAIAVLLLSTLVFLYVRTQKYNESDYIADVAMFRELKKLDAQWELDALKSRLGVNSHYDALANSQREILRLLDFIEADQAAEDHDDAEALARARAALRRAVEEKAALIDQFKSSNSLLRNSRAFLPVAADDVKAAIGAGNWAKPSFKATVAGVDKLLLATALNSRGVDEDHNAEIQAGLNEFQLASGKLPRAIEARLDIFLVHVYTIFTEQKALRDLLLAIAGAPTALRIDELDKILDREQSVAAAQNWRYRQYLFVFSTVLVALLLYAAVQIIRSRAMIQRTNSDLHVANENLEQRVQVRTQELRLAQSELVAAARQAGKAEIATNVLHNVGNVLNSVNISAGLIEAELTNSKVGGLSRAVGLMDDHVGKLGEFFTCDSKGVLLPGYLRELARTLKAEHGVVADELRTLVKSVDHIKEVVAAQQSYAGTSCLTESAKVDELLDDALRINAGALTRHNVTVVREIADLPALPLDRPRVLQVLVNLISNAQQAMKSMVDHVPCITVGARLADDGVLRFTVADNGEGIAPENLTRIFSHGFTTRKDGHGFGLHSCVLAAREMGGSLNVFSKGPGLGSIFTLDMPIGTGGCAT